MNKNVLSGWRSLFFRHNINKIRKTILDYLANEGIDAQVKDGVIRITLDDFHYTIEFDLSGEYPRCDISFQIDDEEYKSLKLSQKTFIADKINTDEDRRSTVKAFNTSIVVDTHFYFANKRMLLSLFCDYFVDLKETLDETIDLTVSEIQEAEQKRRPIGFAASMAAKEKSKNLQSAACGKNDVK